MNFLDHDSENWQVVLNLVMNLRVPKNGGKLFITCRSVSFWRWLFSMELLVINFYILRVYKVVFTEVNWKHGEFVGKPCICNTERKGTGWGTKHNLYTFVLDCLSVTSFLRHLYCNVQLHVGWHGWQLKASKLCWLKKMYTNFHTFDQKKKKKAGNEQKKKNG